MLDCFFTLDSKPNFFMSFGIDETFKLIPFGETIHHSFPVFPGTPRKVRRDTDVERSVAFVRDDVNPTSLHGATMKGTLDRLNAVAILIDAGCRERPVLMDSRNKSANDGNISKHKIHVIAALVAAIH